MGSLSPLHEMSREMSLENYRICVAYCSKDPTIDSKVENWIECYDLLSNSWHRVSTIPGIDNHVIKDFALVSVRDSIYVIGGRLCSIDEVESELEVVSCVLRYNITSNSWSKCAPLGMARYDFACAVNDEKIFVAGGQCTLGSAKGISSAEVYDPTLDEWKQLPKMNTLRYKCAGVMKQGKFHVMGGFSGGDSQGPFMVDRSSAEVYDMCTATWQLKPRMWELDVPPNQIVAVNDKLFSCGDCYKIWKGHVEAYDEKVSIWNIVDGSYLNTSMLDANDSLVWLTMAPIGIHLYFLAGHRMEGEVPKTRVVVHAFDTSSANENMWNWKSFEPLEEKGKRELCGHCCVVKLEP